MLSKFCHFKSISGQLQACSTKAAIEKFMDGPKRRLEATFVQ